VKKQTHTLVVLVNLLFCITASGALASSPWNFGIDLTYEKTDTTQANENSKKSVDLKQEYRLLHNASLSLDTKIATELRASVERENREERENQEGSTDSDTSINKPYANFQMKSRLYDFELGYQGSNEKTNSTLNTDEAFFDCKLQPEYLPELNVKYDFKGETKSDNPDIYTHNISVGSLYNVQDFLRIRLDYEGEVTDYKDTGKPSETSDTQPSETSGGDIKKGNFLGQVTLKHFLLNNKLRFSLDYKAEQESEKDQEQLYDDFWTKVNDQFIQTVNSQITYAITPSTTLSAQYENKHTQDKVDNIQDTTGGTEQKDNFRMDLSQRICSYMTVLGKYRSEKNKDENQDESADTYEAEINANPQRWLDLRGKVATESRNINGLEDDGLDNKEDTQTIEGTWGADFPQLLDTRNTFDVKLVREKKDGLDSSREKHYRWKLQLTPIINLSLTPEYDFTEEKEYLPFANTVTREFRTVAAYGLSFSSHLKVNLSHSLSRKRIEEEQFDMENNMEKENNDDTKLDITFTPTQNLIFSSQIVRQDKSKRIFQNGYLTTQDEVDTSYAINYDWRFDPFTWSSSFKYDDRKGEDSGSDTEALESRLTYTMKKNYDFTMNYKYTKTYSVDNDKETRIGFHFRAYY